MKKRTPQPQRPDHSNDPASRPRTYEAEVAEGLEEIAADEIRRRLGGHLYGKLQLLPSAVRFQFVGWQERLRALRTAQTVYHVEHFNEPRPRALLGNEQLRIVINNIQNTVAEAPASSFKRFDIHAAGADTPVMRRIRDEIAARTGLEYAHDGGDLVLRIRPASDHTGWEVLTRTTPRPLATRDWRVCNLEGALNAPIAHAMNLMTRPTPGQTYVNLGCGSGTLLIERLAYGPATKAIGFDDDGNVLACARDNATAARLTGVSLIQASLEQLPLESASVDVVTADLPFGQAIGSHRSNQALYPLLITEAGRIARRGAIFAAITHEVKLMESILSEQPWWATLRVIRTNLRGLHPRIYILERAIS